MEDGPDSKMVTNVSFGEHEREPSIKVSQKKLDKLEENAT